MQFNHPHALMGGAFLIQDTEPADVFTPEDFTAEQRMIARATAAFVEGEVLPRLDQLERLDLDLTRQLMRRAAELGLLGVEIPEEYGGLNLDQASATLVAEHISRAGSFGVSFGGHVGIGLLPIVYFGSDDQKRRYLPGLADGTILAAYALTEAGSGSDALAAQTTAILAPDGGHYLLNGEKLWITNAGFADIFITFAQVDGRHFTAFIIERDFPGVSTGAEELKLGLHGASTRAVILQDAQVPVGNVLGSIGRGARIAFGVLNIGRLKLGAGCIGNCKDILTDAVQYANRRHQFGRPIAAFGAIQHKLAEMCIRAWVGESVLYRTVGLINQRLNRLDWSDSEAVSRGIGEYAAECSMIKVLGSEFLDYAADECLQIFGGYGYSGHYPAERYFRDARINRIYEGTSEINRLLIAELLLKRIGNGQLPVMEIAGSLGPTIEEDIQPADGNQGRLESERRAVKNARKATAWIMAAAVRKYGSNLASQQEILMAACDMVMDLYAMESALLRVTKIQAGPGASDSRLVQEIAGMYLSEALGRIESAAREILAALFEGETLRSQLDTVRKLLGTAPRNAIAARRAIAGAVIAANAYPFR